MKLLNKYKSSYLNNLTFLKDTLVSLKEDVKMTPHVGDAAGDLMYKITQQIEKKKEDIDELEPYVLQIIKAYLEENILKVIKEIDGNK